LRGSTNESSARHVYIGKVIFPISDENPRTRVPVVTIGIIVLNTLIWLWTYFVHGVPLATLDYGAIPSWVLHHVRDGQLLLPDGAAVMLHQEVPWPFTILTSMFMHGGWMHIIGNMWFLWIFGDNLEDRLGPVRYLVFYLLVGFAAAAAQILASPSSAVPMVGASGAIAGVMGGYLLLYPQARVRCLAILIVFITTLRVPAWIVLGFWFLSQFFVSAQSGVAWMAHVGGFIAGVALVKLFIRPASWPPRRSSGLPGTPPSALH
jgi:membrane associated rhomboid family serine protease